MPERVVVNVDGGARSNPGPAAVGVVVATPEGEVIEAVGETIGSATNNVAEYRALLRGIALAKQHGARRGRVRRRFGARREAGPRRVQGQGRDPEASCSPRSAGELAGFERWSISHVRRERNAAADALVNEALDAGRSPSGS